MEIRPIIQQKKIGCGTYEKCPRGSGKTACVCKCPCGKARYRQPARPKSFAPTIIYVKPQCPLESNTIYRNSYLPTAAEKVVQTRPITTLAVPNAKFAQDTINKMSYRGWCNFKPPMPSAPCNNLRTGTGPMAEITTNRHDYVPKCVAKPEVTRPINNIYTTPAPLSNQTINRLSYQPVTAEKVVQIIPPCAIPPAEGNMSRITVQKMSYQPFPLPCKENFPWAMKETYAPPCQPFAKDTIYNKSYQPSCAPRTQIYHPPCKENPLTSGTAFESATVYRNSYQPNARVEIPQLILPCDNINICKERMSSDTINKMSYRPNCGFKPPSPVKACCHDLLGKGPMAEITTTRHDYVPKQICVVTPVRHGTTIATSNEPLSNCTINRLSYQPTGQCEIPRQIKPVTTLGTVPGKFEDCTIQKLSYQPIGPIAKCDLPWAARKAYVAPNIRMATDTVYNLSFDSPGQYIGEDCNCRCAYEEPPCVPQMQNCLSPILC